MMMMMMAMMIVVMMIMMMMMMMMIMNSDLDAVRAVRLRFFEQKGGTWSEGGNTAIRSVQGECLSVCLLVMQQVLLAKEHLLVMAVPVETWGETLPGFPKDVEIAAAPVKRRSSGKVVISPTLLKSMCGNSMHLAAVGTMLLFALSHSSFQKRQGSVLSEAQQSRADEQL